jgi:hypothetical protein
VIGLLGWDCRPIRRASPLFESFLFFCVPFLIHLGIYLMRVVRFLTISAFKTQRRPGLVFRHAVSQLVTKDVAGFRKAVEDQALTLEPTGTECAPNLVGLTSDRIFPSPFRTPKRRPEKCKGGKLTQRAESQWISMRSYSKSGINNARPVQHESRSFITVRGTDNTVKTLLSLGEALAAGFLLEKKAKGNANWSS